MADRVAMVAGAALACVAGGIAAGQSSRALYRVEIETHWTAAVHGDAYTAGAHFSWPVGMVHSDAAGLWAPGAIASEALERMAEAGRGIGLFEQAEGFVDAGTALEAVSGRGMDAEETQGWNLWFSTEHHRLTLVSMIAPSPDWFIGTHGLSLVDGQGAWIDEVVMPLEAYDSGTDSGDAFTSPNADTQPREPIRNIQAEAPFNGVPVLATMRLTLQEVETCIADVNRDGVLSPADFNAWIIAFNNGDAAADQNGDGDVTPADFNGWILNFNAGC